MPPTTTNTEPSATADSRTTGKAPEEGDSLAGTGTAVMTTADLSRLESARPNTNVWSTGEFASVSAGDQHTCGVKADGSVACWGYRETIITPME